MPLSAPVEPWLSYLNALDAALGEVTELHCVGGFAVVHAYGLERATADIDVIARYRTPPAQIRTGAL